MTSPDDDERREKVMRDIEQILQDSGIPSLQALLGARSTDHSTTGGPQPRHPFDLRGSKPPTSGLDT